MTDPVAVVIVNHRTPELVASCIESIDLAGADVVVVDNASGDGSAEALARRGVRVLEQHDNAGFAAGVNAGMRATDAPVVVVLNPDTTCRPGALARLVEELGAHPEAAVVAPAIVGRDDRPRATAYRRFPGVAIVALELSFPLSQLAARWPRWHPYRARPASWRDAGPVAHVQGAAMAIRRAAWLDTGGLDDRYFLYFEETEWQRRLHASGWTVRLVPDATVAHLGRGGADDRVPAIEFVHSAERYLASRRVPGVVARTAIASALLTSRVALRVPWVAHRRPGEAAQWDALWRAWRARQR